MGTSSMYHMYCGIIHLDGPRSEQEVKQLYKWLCHKKEMAGRHIGDGLDLAVGWNGVLVLHHGVLINVAILKAV